VSTVGQAKTPSPWGTYDMGGNVVEVLDTLAPEPAGYHFIRDWRYYHGGSPMRPPTRWRSQPSATTPVTIRSSKS
jgi:hypothetical protein